MAVATRLSRREVATLLRMSVQGVAAIEQRGELTATRVDGQVFYSAEEVELLRQTRKPRAKKPPRPGVVDPFAARVALLIRQGKSLPDIVIATKADPDYVRKIWETLNVPLEQTPVLRARQRDEQLDEVQREQEAWDRRVEMARLHRRRG